MLQCRRRWSPSTPAMYGILSSCLKIGNQSEASGYSRRKPKQMDRSSGTRLALYSCSGLLPETRSRLRRNLQSGRQIRIIPLPGCSCSSEVSKASPTRHYFTNGHLEEEVFKRQPEGFVEEGKEHLVCKLKQSLYGLKQFPRCWNSTLDAHLKGMDMFNPPTIHASTRRQKEIFPSSGSTLTTS